MLTIDLVTLQDTTTQGLLADFDDTADYLWTLATAQGGITGFDAGLFSLNLAGFANVYTGSFAVEIAQDAQSLWLRYTAADDQGTPQTPQTPSIPEPASVALLGLGGLALLARRQRR